MNRFRQVRDRGGRYLLRQTREDGGFGDLGLGVTEYYKVPAAFMVCGMTGAAGRLLDWIRRHRFLSYSDFGPRPAGELDSYYYTYYKAAYRMGTFDLTQRGMDSSSGTAIPKAEGSTPTRRNEMRTPNRISGARAADGGTARLPPQTTDGMQRAVCPYHETVIYTKSVTDPGGEVDPFT